MMKGITTTSNLIKVTEAYAEFINQYPWDWYATLTFRHPVGSRIAFKLFNRWKVWLKKAVKQKVQYFMVIEKTSSNTHIHSFIKGVKDEKPYVWKQHWHSLAGISDIRKYDNNMAASSYLSEKIVVDNQDVLWSNDLNKVV